MFGIPGKENNKVLQACCEVPFLHMDNFLKDFSLIYCIIFFPTDTHYTAVYCTAYTVQC